MSEKKNLLIGVTGGIAAYKVCEVASYFTKKGVNVNVVMTELKNRLVGRNTEDESAIKVRIETAYKELREAPKLYDFFVVNDTVDSAAAKIENILEAKRCGKTAMETALKQILEEVDSLA